MTRRPVIVILGRPNVGKSTLVNRIVRRKSAVVDEQAGVTRDRREFDGEWNGREFIVVDTGGWEHRPGEQLVADIREQGAKVFDHEAAVVLRAIERGARPAPEDTTAADNGTGYLDLMRRLLQTSESRESAPPETSASPLILP